jgi:hypothetical protein
MRAVVERDAGGGESGKDELAFIDRSGGLDGTSPKQATHRS